MDLDRDHVAGLKRDKGRLFVVACNGTEVPVSRTYTEAVRRRFADGCPEAKTATSKCIESMPVMKVGKILYGHNH
jgi:hypothetical protein